MSSIGFPNTGSLILNSKPSKSIASQPPIRMNAWKNSALKHTPHSPRPCSPTGNSFSSSCLRLHSEHQPLNKNRVIPDIINRESRLAFSLTKVGFREGFLKELFYAGFRPCRRGTVVLAKVPKTIAARARPCGRLHHPTESRWRGNSLSLS